MNGNSNWATGTLKEAPYWRDGMSPEEYEVERVYFYQNWDQYVNGAYVPLWKQRGRNEPIPTRCPYRAIAAGLPNKDTTAPQ